MLEATWGALKPPAGACRLCQAATSGGQQRRRRQATASPASLPYTLRLPPIAVRSLAAA